MTASTGPVSYLTGANVPRPDSIGKQLMRGAAQVPDWLPLLHRLRQDDPHFSNAGADGARLKSDFDGARQNLERHFRDGASALPLTEDDIRKAWERTRGLGPDITGQKRFQPFAENLQITAKPRIDALRSELIRIAKRGPEATHHEKTAAIATAGDAANELLRQRRELHFKTCNEHFGEVLAQMHPGELIRVDAAQLEIMAKEHYLHLTGLGEPTTEVLRASRKRVIDALVADETRRADIFSTTTGGTLTAPVPAEAGKKPRTDAQLEGDQKRKDAAQRKKDEVAATQRRLEELEAENARLREGNILTEHPAGTVVGEHGTNGTLSHTVNGELPHGSNGVTVTSDTLIPPGELPHPTNGVAGVLDHPHANGTLTEPFGTLVSDTHGGLGSQTTVFDRNILVAPGSHGHMPNNHHLPPLEPHTPFGDGGGNYLSSLTTNDADAIFTIHEPVFPPPEHFPPLPPPVATDPLNVVVEPPPVHTEPLPASPPVVTGDPIPPPVHTEPLPTSPPVVTGDPIPPPVHTEPLPTSPPVVTGDPIPPPPAREPPVPASTHTNDLGHTAASTENALVQGERLAAQESNLVKKGAQLAAKEEGLIAKVLTSIERNPGLAGAAAAVAAIGAYQLMSKPKDEASYAQRIRTQRNAGNEPKTDPFKPDADVKMGSSLSAKDLAKSDPNLQPSR